MSFEPGDPIEVIDPEAGHLHYGTYRGGTGDECLVELPDGETAYFPRDAVVSREDAE